MKKLIKNDLYLLLIDEEAEILCITKEILLSKDKSLLCEITETKYKQHFRGINIVSNIEVAISYHQINDFYKVVAYYPLNSEAKELDLPLLPSFEGDVWVKGNRISVTTLYEYEEQQDWPNHNKYENLGYQTYTGEVIELDKGLALKTDDGKIFKTQGTYWFGSILDQNCKLLKAAQFKQFSLEDVKKAIKMAREQSEPYYGGGGLVLSEPIYEDKHTEEEIIQSLSTQKLPKEFIPEYEIVYSSKELADKGFIYEEVFKTITNSEGKQELVGTYKY